MEKEETGPPSTLTLCICLILDMSFSDEITLSSYDDDDINDQCTHFMSNETELGRTSCASVDSER